MYRDSLSYGYRFCEPEQNGILDGVGKQNTSSVAEHEEGCETARNGILDLRFPFPRGVFYVLVRRG